MEANTHIWPPAPTPPQTSGNSQKPPRTTVRRTRIAGFVAGIAYYCAIWWVATLNLYDTGRGTSWQMELPLGLLVPMGMTFVVGLGVGLILLLLLIVLLWRKQRGFSLGLAAAAAFYAPVFLWILSEYITMPVTHSRL